jgi:hypothetical protein
LAGGRRHAELNVVDQQGAGAGVADDDVLLERGPRRRIRREGDHRRVRLDLRALALDAELDLLDAILDAGRVALDDQRAGGQLVRQRSQIRVAMENELHLHEVAVLHRLGDLVALHDQERAGLLEVAEVVVDGLAQDRQVAGLEVALQVDAVHGERSGAGALDLHDLDVALVTPLNRALEDEVGLADRDVVGLALPKAALATQAGDGHQ